MTKPNRFHYKYIFFVSLNCDVGVESYLRNLQEMDQIYQCSRGDEMALVLAAEHLGQVIKENGYQNLHALFLNSK